MATVTTNGTGRKPRVSKPAHGTVKWVLAMSAMGFGILEITNERGTKRYSVVKLPHGGFRLLTEAGELYDIDTADPAVWSCSCPDFIHSRAQRDPNGCKHVAGLRAALKHLEKAVPLPAPKPAHRSLGDVMKNDP